MAKPKEEFYKELDRDVKREREKTLSFWTLAIFFLLIIIAGEILLFTLGSKLRSTPQGNFSVKGLGEGLNLSSTNQSGEQSQTIITQGTLCANMIEKLSGDVSCTISPTGIVISGKFSPVLPKNSSVYLMPTVKDGAINIDVDKITIGSIGISKIFAAPVSTFMASAIRANLPSGYKPVRIDLQEAVMVIVCSKS